MKVKVIENLCIGCGACAASVPEVFDLSDSGVAFAIDEEVKEDLVQDVEDASDNCPTGAININK